MSNFNINDIRKQFPVLDQQVYGKPLVYFDNAATTQKPLCVIERERDYYLHENCNIHRGVHYLSQMATEAYENARKTIAQFVNARQAQEIVFTRGTTESLNLLATSLGQLLVDEGDKVVVSAMEHHSNMVPWQQMLDRINKKNSDRINKTNKIDSDRINKINKIYSDDNNKMSNLLVIRMDKKGVLDLNHYEELLKQRPKIVSIAHISNTLGTVNPIKEMIAMAHKYDIPVIIDGAQSMAHQVIDVQDLDCDFYVFSGHKTYAPMGIGGLYGKMEWLEKMPPYQFGGEMVDTVSFEKTTFNKVPFKFEAGTPNVGAALGLETAVKFIQSFDRQEVEDYEDELLRYATEQLANIEGMRFIGQAPKRNGLVSFVIDGIHPYDLGTIIDKMGVAVRTGHHCAEPVMTFFGIPGTVRASFAMYNTKEEIDIFVKAVERAANMLK